MLFGNTAQCDRNVHFLQSTVSSRRKDNQKPSSTLNHLIVQNRNSSLNGACKHQARNHEMIPDPPFLAKIHTKYATKHTKKVPKLPPIGFDTKQKIITPLYMLPQWKIDFMNWDKPTKKFSRQETENMRDIHMKNIKRDLSSIYGFLQPNTTSDHTYNKSLQMSHKMNQQALKLTKSKYTTNNVHLPRISRLGNSLDLIKKQRRIEKDQFKGSLKEIGQNMRDTYQKQFEAAIKCKYGCVENEYKLSKMSDSYYQHKYQHICKHGQHMVNPLQNKHKRNQMQKEQLESAVISGDQNAYEIGLRYVSMYYSGSPTAEIDN